MIVIIDTRNKSLQMKTVICTTCAVYAMRVYIDFKKNPRFTLQMSAFVSQRETFMYLLITLNAFTNKRN